MARVDEVRARVAAHERERRLRSGEHDGPIEPGQEERERARRVRHRVGAVHDDYAVVAAPGERLVQHARELDPVVRLHVARVEVPEDARLDLGDLAQHGQLGEEIARVVVGRERGDVAAAHHERAAGVHEEEPHAAHLTPARRRRRRGAADVGDAGGGSAPRCTRGVLRPSRGDGSGNSGRGGPRATGTLPAAMSDVDEPRSALEIGRRALVLGYILSSFELDGQKEKLNAELVRHAEPVMRPSDWELLQRGDWSPEVQQSLLWQIECLAVLLWALGKMNTLPRVEEMVAHAPVVAEIDAMSRGPEAWLASLALRPLAELDAYNELVSFWLWRVRTPGRKKKPASPWVSAVKSARERGVLRSSDVIDDDAGAFGKPFFQLAPEKQAFLGEIVHERCRAMFWLWRDFDDWWEPVLDS